MPLSARERSEGMRGDIFEESRYPDSVAVMTSWRQQLASPKRVPSDRGPISIFQGIRLSVGDPTNAIASSGQ